MLKNKKILMICYYYPPLADVGSKRSVAFSKYFQKFGWTPFILSVKNPDRKFCIMGRERPPSGIQCEYSYSLLNPFTIFGKINGLLTRLAGLLGIRIRRNYFYDYLCIPDLFWPWIPCTVFQAWHMVRKHKIDLIYASCPPFSSALIGWVVKTITGKPLVMDFREAYALNTPTLSWLYQKPKLRKMLDRKIEKMLLKHCNLLSIVTEDLRKLYLEQYPPYRSKIFTIHNGFDPELFARIETKPKYDTFTLIYAGRFFYETDPTPFFEALALLKNQKKCDLNHFQFVYYGKEHDAIRELSKKIGIEEIVDARPQAPYPEILTAMSRAHLGLLRNMQWAIPVKLFDYLFLDLPCLAIIPDGEAAAILKAYSPHSYIVAEQSVEEISRAILNARSSQPKPLRADSGRELFLREFGLENLALKYMQIIETTIFENDERG